MAPAWIDQGADDVTVSLETPDEPVVAAWRALADRLESTPFRGPDWILAWWEAFGGGRLRVVVARRATRVVGLLPVLAGMRLRSPTNFHTPDHGPLAEDRGVAAALITGALMRTRSSICLAYLDRDADDADALGRRAEQARFRTQLRELEWSPFVTVAGSFEAYEAALRRGVRNDLRRRHRRLEERGRLTFDVGRAFDERYAEFSVLEAAGWKGTRGTAVGASDATRRFYGEVGRSAAARGELRLLRLALDGRTVAAMLALERFGVLYTLKAGFDSALAAYSPGRLLLRETLAEAWRRGLERVELLGADEPYKRAFASGWRTRVELTACAPSIAGQLTWGVETGLRPVARRAMIAGRGRGRRNRHLRRSANPGHHRP